MFGCLLCFPSGALRARRVSSAASRLPGITSPRFALHGWQRTTNSNHKQPVFDNLLNRKFDVAQSDQVYAADVTYIWTQEGWLYLAVVIDMCSRKVVGWSMSSQMKAKLVCDALQMAIWRRKPRAGLIHHSDRGSQYASKAFRRLLKAHGINGSMSRKGDCWDTQSTILLNVQSNLTRAGIGEATRHVMRPSRTYWNIFRCFITAVAYIHTWAI